MLMLSVAATGLSGCAEGGSDSGKDTLSGSAEEILATVIDSAGDAIGADKLPETFTNPVTADGVENMLGMTADQFGQYVTEAVSATAAINIITFEAVLIKCKDSGAASEVKKILAESYDPGKWICVRPELCAVTDSGSYVLLVTGNQEQADAILASFGKAAEGNIGEADRFFEGEN